MISELLHDVRHALRQLARLPGLTFVAIVSLSLGIGANTALFELANRVLLHPLDVAQPDRLVSIVDGDEASQRWDENTYHEFVTYRDRNAVFSGVAASSETGAGLSAGDVVRPITVSEVSRNYFSVLGVGPSLGLAFTGADVPSGSDDGQVILGHALWAASFGADPAIVGRIIRLNGTPFTVIGVAPPGFTGVGLALVDAWVPLHAVPLLATGFDTGGDQLSLANDHSRWLRVTGRLKPGLTIDQARANVTAVRNGIPYPRDELPPDGHMATALVTTVSTVSLMGNDAGSFVLLLTGVVVFTLLIACANLATLLLATGTARAREFGVRVALGAGRGRLIRQLVTESTLLALLGGVASLLVASWTGDLLRSFRSAGGIQFNAVVRDPGMQTVMIALTLALVTSMLIGLAPAVVVTGRDPAAALGSRHRLETSSQSRVRSWLMATQIALALVLLTGAGLFARSLRNAIALDLGFDTNHLAVVGFNLGQQRYDSARAVTFYQELLARTLAAPGIERAALAARVPVRAPGARSSAWVDAPAGPRNVGEHSFNVVGPGYFETLGIPIVSGRAFSAADDSHGSRAVIVNEAFARLAWPGENALGKRFFYGNPQDSPPMFVVGVARNSKYRSLRENALPYYYLPLWQHFEEAGLASIRLVFRSAAAPEPSIASVRSVVRALDQSLPLFQAETVVSQIGVLLTAQRMGTTILSLLGAIGLVIALSGLYGVVSYGVARRTHELGVRIALGAQARDVLRLTVGQGLRPVLAGALAGALLVVALGKAASSFMYGVAPRDPMTLGIAVTLLLLVSVAAMLVPARRATRIAPTQALREE